jgi:hypothetical protein
MQSITKGAFPLQFISIASPSHDMALSYQASPFVKIFLGKDGLCEWIAITRANCPSDKNAPKWRLPSLPQAG